MATNGGTESVQAFQGGNTITTGSGDDSIQIAGSNNVVDAGGGNNTVYDAGSNNTIVLPGSGGYDDVYGYALANGDQFDLRPLLAGTSWNGDPGSIGNYLSVGQSGNSAVISVNPDGTAGGATSGAATLEDSGSVTVATLLSHAIV